MEVLLGEDGYIYIARDKEHLQQLQNRNQAATVQKQETEHQKIVGKGPVKKNFTLIGEILDKSTAERIPYAMITINGTSTGAMTDANGRFTLTKVPSRKLSRFHRVVLLFDRISSSCINPFEEKSD